MAAAASVEEELQRLYYDPRTGFVGADVLWRNAKKAGVKVTLKTVKEWIAKQEVAQISAPRRTNYNSFVPRAPLDQFQIDLVVLDNAHKFGGFEYILTCVDTFSKVGDAVALRGKDGHCGGRHVGHH